MCVLCVVCVPSTHLAVSRPVGLQWLVAAGLVVLLVLVASGELREREGGRERESVCV